MLCRDLGRALLDHGIHASSGRNGNDTADGILEIAPNVCVEVPTFGDRPRVVVDSLRFDVLCYPPRETVAEIARDIRDALRELPCALSSSSIH